MIQKLQKVTNGLYRGGAPTPKDVLWLKENLHINKIISLDQMAGTKINRVCEMLHIQHINLPIDSSRQSLLNVLQHDLKKLLLNNGPTYIHCQAGKDRTGLIIALFKCKYMNVDPEVSIKEAKSLGFGIGIDPRITQLYEKIIRKCKPSRDINNSDIVSNEREYKNDNQDSFLETTYQGSFSTYLDTTIQNSMDDAYNYMNVQVYEPIKMHQSKNNIPQVGIFNNDAGVKGFGPTENYGGFFYD